MVFIKVYDWEKRYKIESDIDGDFDYYKIAIPITQKRVEEKVGKSGGEKVKSLFQN